MYELLELWWNDADKENRRTLSETCPSAILSITNPTWTDPGTYQSLHSERSVTNCLSYGMAYNHTHMPLYVWLD
jgi:hypothetical protein